LVNPPPGMKTISPPGLAVGLGPPPRLTLRAMLMQLCRLRARFCRGEDRFPVVLHVYHGPAVGRRLVERLVELAHVGIAVIGIFPRRVGVMPEAHEAEALAERRPFQHLLVAGGIAEGEGGLPPDEVIDAFRLAGAVVDQQPLWLLPPP